MTTDGGVSRGLRSLLLSADAAFILLHLFHAYTPYFAHKDFSLEQDNGFAEVFQYVKWYWIGTMLLRLSFRTRQAAFGFWALAFGYLLLDDALQIHERGGAEIARRFGYASLFHLRAQDFGELTVTALAAAAFFALIGGACLRSAAAVREVSKRLLILLGAVAVCGVGFDLLHVMLRDLRGGSLLALLEDGGEMVLVSLTCWYVSVVLEHEGRDPFP